MLVTDHVMIPLSWRYCPPSLQDKQYLVETLPYFAKLVNNSDRFDLLANLDSLHKINLGFLRIICVDHH